MQYKLTLQKIKHFVALKRGKGMNIVLLMVLLLFEIKQDTQLMLIYIIRYTYFYLLFVDNLHYFTMYNIY